MFESLLTRLQEPFPDRSEGGHYWRDLILIGAFITLFLYVLRPFGMHRVPQYLFLICVGYGLVTILFAASFHFFSRRLLKIRTDLPSWTLWKWIVHSMLLLAWIAVGNFLFLYLINDSPGLTLGVYLTMLKTTIYVGVFPVVFSGLLVQVRAANANQAEASQIEIANPQETRNTASISFTLSPTESFEVPAESLRYIEAMQNYVAIHYLEADAIKNELVRKTIAKTEAELNGSPLIRCHRSFLVNVDAVIAVSGNAQGLKLRLDGIADIEVPVSRPYIPRIREMLAP